MFRLQSWALVLAENGFNFSNSPLFYKNHGRHHKTPGRYLCFSISIANPSSEAHRPQPFKLEGQAYNPC